MRHYTKFMGMAGMSAAVFACAIAWPVAAVEPEGQRSFEDRCGECHDASDPEGGASAEWLERLQQKGPVDTLDPQTQAEVLDFMRHHNRSATEVVSMARERRLFEEKCSLCHSADRIFLEPLTPESQRHIVLRMRQRAPDWISPEEVEDILAFLRANTPGSAQPQREEVGDEPAMVFRERCSTCHTLERVYLALEQSDGTAPAWMHVVQRMQAKAPQWISAEEATLILDYLQSLKPVSGQ